MNKTIISVLLIISMSIYGFALGNNEGSKTTGSSPESIKLSIWAVEAAIVPVKPMALANWAEVEKTTGIKLSWNLVSTKFKDELFNLILASGNMPDIMAYYEGDKGFTSINKYGLEGVFLPLESLIEKNAPNLKAVILDDEQTRKKLTAADGHIYYIPMISALNAARGWYIRYDWLEKLGLKVPTTTEEFYNVLLSFRDNDPNGNGKKDEIPLVFRRRGDDAFYNLGALAYAFNADMSWVIRNGKVIYGPSEPQYIDYLNYIAELYNEDLIDHEIFNRQGNARNNLFSLNVAGATHDWFASTAGLNDKLPAEFPGFELKHMPPPLGTVEKPFTRIQMSTVRGDGGWAVSHTNPDPVATIKMMDFLFSEEGRMLMNFGVEGDTYTIQDGKPVYTKKITENPTGLGFHEALVTNGLQWKIGFPQDLEYEKQFANPIATAARIDYMENYIIEEFPTLSFTEEEQYVIDDKFSKMRSYVLETSGRAMVGAISPAGFSSAMSELDNMGLVEVTAIYQSAYNREMK